MPDSRLLARNNKKKAVHGCSINHLYPANKFNKLQKSRRPDGSLLRLHHHPGMIADLATNVSILRLFSRQATLAVRERCSEESVSGV